MTGYDQLDGVHIPWQRLTTAYGRGTELPALMAARAYEKIAPLIEHQSTLWQVTPWVLAVLLRQLATRPASDVTAEEIELYGAVADALEGRQIAAVDYVPEMELLLQEAYLWPEDEADDEEAWEEEEPPGYAELPFSSYYCYSYARLKEALPTFAKSAQENGDIAEVASRLVQAIVELDREV